MVTLLKMTTRMPWIEESLAACVQCGYCIAGCQAHRQTPWESDTPRGKIYYINQFNGKTPLDGPLGRVATLNPYFVDAMYKCTGCGTCEAVCHANIHLVELWEEVRKWLVEEGIAPLSVHKGMHDRVVQVHNPYGGDPKKRGDWWPAEVPRYTPCDVVFFAGCTGSYRQQGIPQTGVRILDRAGVKMNILGADEWCCTSPLLRTGDESQSLECAEHIVEAADGLGAKDMVMTCSGCYKTVSTDFGRFYACTQQNVYHFTQYAEKLIDEKKLVITKPFNHKVTYHDPCHLGRHMGVYDAPRNIMAKIKGLELVEMKRNRVNSMCCGAGGGYKSQFNNFAVRIASDRVREAESTGAEYLVTACPFCVTNLSQGAAAIGSKIKVVDLSDILFEVTAPVEEEAKTE